VTTSDWPLGRELRRRRDDAGLSQRQAAARAGISESKWRQLEHGTMTMSGQAVHVKPRPTTVAAAARAVGLPVARALELSGESPTEHPDLLVDAAPADDRVPGFAALTERQRAAVVELVASMLAPATGGDRANTVRTGEAPSDATKRGNVLFRTGSDSIDQTGAS